MLTIAEQQQRAVRWELVQLTPALAEIEGPVLLLKGAAYAAAGLPPAAGRLFSDIDILVPKAQIGAAEAALMLDGWVELPPQRVRPALLPRVDARDAADDAHPAPDRARPAPQHPARDGPPPHPAGA